MSKKGIASIGGNPNPVIGTPEVYYAKTMYAGTVLPESDYGKIKWALFKKVNGEWIGASVDNKTGFSVTYNFNESALNKELLLEAYVTSPEMKVTPGMLIKPKQAQQPSFTKLEVLDSEGNPVKAALSYGQTIVAKATCAGMEGQSVTFQLWEDDMKGEGHNKANEVNRCELLTQIVKKGNASVNFIIKPDFAKIANAYFASDDSSEGATHEYYVTVQDTKTYLASKNVNVKNPGYVAPVAVVPEAKPPVSKPKPKQETKSDPAPKQPEPVKVIVEPVVKPDVKPEPKNSPVVVNGTGAGNCNEKYCIKKGDKSELIRELNIRLAGFGGNVPTDEFTDRTEKMIKQFQKDYMKVPETGKVCGNLLRAVDAFQNKYSIDINQAKCPCGQCSGFGNGKNSNERNNSSILEMYRKYEYPGMHRIILWTQRAIQFYLANQEKDRKLTVGVLFSGYRCTINNKQKGRKSTNHMGKASDLHIYGGSGDREKNANAVRDVLVKYSGAKYRWDHKNAIGLEADNRNGTASDFKASTWVHYDVRTYDLKYLEDKYFAKTMVECNGKSIVQLATELGFEKTCSCLEGKAATKEVEKSEPVKKSGLFDVPILKTLSSHKDLKEISEILNEYAPKYQINTPLRAAHFLAQVTHETDGFVIKEESYRYSKKRIKQIFGRYFPGEVPDKYANSKLLFDRTYADRMGNGNEASGDGSKFRGRGAIQLTGRESYRNFTKWYKTNFNEDVDFEANPDLLITSNKYILLSAIWEYYVDKSNLNRYADKDDIKTITKRINGGLNGFDDRKRRLGIAKKAYGI